MPINPSVYKTLDGGGYPRYRLSLGRDPLHRFQQVDREALGSETLFPPQPKEDGTVPNGDFYRPQEFSADGSPKPLIPKFSSTAEVT